MRLRRSCCPGDRAGHRVSPLFSLAGLRSQILCEHIEAAVPAFAVLVALLSVAEEFVRQNHLGGIPPFTEFDRDQSFLLLLFLLTGSGEPLPRPREDELLGNLYLPENDSLAVNAAIRSPDLQELVPPGRTSLNSM